MFRNKFIKVTPKGGGTPVILPDVNRTFYLSQEATIETPTEAEIMAQFPEYAARVARKQTATPQGRNNNDSLKHQIQKLNDEVTRLKKDVADRDAKIAELEAANTQLRALAGGDAPADAPEPEPEQAPAEEKKPRRNSRSNKK